MAELTFQDLTFREEDEKVRVNFLNIFYFYLDKGLLNKIAAFKISSNAIYFEGISEEKARRRLYLLLEQGFQNLTNRLDHKKAIYIHKNSQIPLIGTNYFGLID